MPLLLIVLVAALLIFFLFKIFWFMVWYFGIGAVWFLLCLLFDKETKESWNRSDPGLLFLYVLWPVDVIARIGSALASDGGKK